MSTLNSLKKDLIILVISYRPASIKMSEIILMAGGELEDVGAYSELVERNDHFREMMTRSID